MPQKIEAIPAEPLPFDEAVKYFKHLLPMSDQEFYALADEAKAMAFAVSSIAQEEAIEDAYKLVLKALEEGQSLEEFKKAFASKMAEHKVGLSDSYMETVFRTNIQRAYNVGRFKQMTRPEVLKSRPYWEYDAVNDSRTRPTHRAMDGRVYRADDPVWDTWYPPNGFRCRCRVNTLSERQVKRLGLEVRKGPVNETIDIPGKGPVPLEPDRGFEHNPGKAMWGFIASREEEALKGEGQWELVWPRKPKEGEDLPDYSNRDVRIRLQKVPDFSKESRLWKQINEQGYIELRDVFGNKIVATKEGLARHIRTHEESDSKRRIQYFDLIEPTLSKPSLVVMTVFKRANSGRIRFRRTYIAGFELGEKKHRYLYTVAQFDKGVWTGWTIVLGSKPSGVSSGMWGFPIYKGK